MKAAISRNWMTGLAIAVIVFVFGCVFASFSGSTYPIRDNIHDLWIPINAGYALDLGMVPHETFHSPFGFFYFFLTSNAFQAITAFPQNLNFPDIHYLTSLQFSVLLAVMFLGTRAISAEGFRIPVWFFVLVLVLSFQARTITDLNNEVPHWYGIYNSQLWALILLQAASIFLWQNMPQTDRRTIGFAVVQAACALVTLNYKISFFLGAGILCLIPYLFLGSLRRMLIYTATGLLTGLVGLWIIAVGGYSFNGYFIDLAAAAEAKGSMWTELDLEAIAIFVALMQIVRHHDKSALPDTQGFFRWWCEYFRVIAANVQARELTFDLGIALAIAAAVMGDYQKPEAPYIIMLAFVMFGPYRGGYFRQPLKRNILHYIVAYYVAAFVLISLQSLSLVARVSDDEPAVTSKPVGRNVVVTINYPPNPFSFRFSKDPTISEILARGLLNKSEAWEQRLVEASYSLFSEGRHDHLGLGGVFQSHEYIEDLNAVLTWFEGKGLMNSGIAIASNGFANPWPVLTGNNFPKQTAHWVHIGTTVAVDSVETLFATLDTADLLLVPLLGTDHNIVQFYLNCSFYLWNLENGSPFVAQDVVGLYLIMTRQNGALPPWMEPPVEFSAQDIAPPCNRLRDRF